jgi:hypothetical protein
MPSRRRDADAREWLAIVKRGQILGFSALVLQPEIVIFVVGGLRRDGRGGVCAMSIT